MPDHTERLEPAIEAADRVISTSPRKAVYEMSWDLAEAAVKAADPIFRKQEQERVKEPLELARAALGEPGTGEQVRLKAFRAVAGALDALEDLDA